MISSVAGLVVAYILTGALLLLLLLRANWSWRWKAAIIATVSVFYVVSYESWPELLGWPSRADVPAKFQMLGAYIQPPDQMLGTEGEIFVWVTDMTGKGDSVTPRAYRLPYDLELRRKVDEAAGNAKKGKAQMAEVEPENAAAPAGPPGTDQLRQKSVRLNFYDLPAPPLPQK